MSELKVHNGILYPQQPHISLDSRKLGSGKRGSVSWSNESSSKSVDLYFQSLDNAVLLMKDRRVSCNWGPLMLANAMTLGTLLYLSFAGHLMNRPMNPTETTWNQGFPWESCYLVGRGSGSCQGVPSRIGARLHYACDKRFTPG